VNTPALDFLRQVQVWQENEANRTAGLVVVMPEAEEDSLDGLLRSLGSLGPSAGLEERARSWLVGYRALEDEQRVLTEDQRRQLYDITDRLAREPRARRRPPGRYIVAAILVLVGALIIALAVNGLVNHARGTNPVQPGQAQGAAPAPVQPGLTAVQQFRQDWGVPAGGQADAGSPAALVLLDNGLYYPSSWSVTPNNAGWTQGDTSDSVAANTIVVQGDQVTFQDGDGNTWTVGTDQPFVLAPNPNTILKIDPAKRVWSMPTTHGITVRHHL
jgi:hypothetical protein